MKPSGIKPATVRLVGQCLNQLRQRLPSLFHTGTPRSEIFVVGLSELFHIVSYLHLSHDRTFRYFYCWSRLSSDSLRCEVFTVIQIHNVKGCRRLQLPSPTLKVKTLKLSATPVPPTTEHCTRTSFIVVPCILITSKFLFTNKCTFY
jgi:hypothetical protein